MVIYAIGVGNDKFFAGGKVDTYTDKIMSIVLVLWRREGMMIELREGKILTSAQVYINYLLIIIITIYIYLYTQALHAHTYYALEII